MLIGKHWVENLVRFPVERRRRPSMDMLTDISPDSRVVALLVEALQQEEDFDPDLRHFIDYETAEQLEGMELPETSEDRRKVLEPMREQAVSEAMAACVEAQSAADVAYLAIQVAVEAETQGDRNAFALRARANRFMDTSARATIEAHRLCEIAAGKNRAIGIAIEGADWLQFNAHEVTEWLLEAGPSRIGQAGG